MTWLLMNWKLVLVGLLIATLAAYGTAMRLQRDGIRAEYAEYRTQVAVAAQAAAENALKKTIEDEKRKEAHDVENLRLVAALNAATRRLRDARDSSRFLSAATSCPTGTEEAAKYKAEFERAYRTLVAGLRELGDECSGETVDLNTAKMWAADGESED